MHLLTGEAKSAIIDCLVIRRSVPTWASNWANSVGYVVQR